ncbi:MAG: preprotein translocase subunit SecE [Caulobacterales bacterium]
MATEMSEQDSEPKRRGGPLAFFREVRAEGRKVTWATRQEVTVSTIMVLIMVVLAAVFFFLVDTIIGFVVNTLLSLT